jgi:serine/threonine protein kinase/formylglycine-generating enzyme required for sulfatase activity
MTFPHLIGRYEIIDELGRGGMATVYRAHDARFRRDVAIKVLPREFLHDPMFRARFEREAQTIAALEHYAIVPVYDFGEHQGQPYLVMRYMPGGSLTDRIRRGPLSLADVTGIITPIAAALDDAHDAGVIHRDVKPANILFGRSGQAHLTDFGIVKIAEATAQLTGSGMIGTPAYMAPEMARSGGLTPLVDVYALGVTLYQMLAGRLPFEADTPMGTVLAHITTPIPDIHDFRADLPAEVQTVIERSLAKDPADRYQRAGDLASALRALAAGELLPADDRPAPTPRGGTTVVEAADETTDETAVEAPESGETALPDDTWGTPPPAAKRPTSETTMERPRRNVLGWTWIGGAVAGMALLAVGLVLAGVIGPPPPVTPTLAATEEEPATVEPARQPTEPTSEPAEEEPTIGEPTHQPTESATEELPSVEECELGYSMDCPVTANDQWEPVIEEKNGIEMALVPAGCFRMGSLDGDSDEAPVHEVCAEEPFWIDLYEVTNEAFGSLGCELYSSQPDQPRNCVNWVDALAHCEARGARLPTEAEWEYAARGPDRLVYPWGNEFVADNVVFSGNNPDSTALVGSKPNGVSWIGAYDLSGNVWEWVNDWYDSAYYSTLSNGMVNPLGPESGSRRALRGGSWGNDTGGLRAANRNWGTPGYIADDVGFRCALSYNP